MPVLIDPLQDSFMRSLYERGLRDGRREAVRNGMAGCLKRQLEHLFGSVPEDIEERLRSADEPELKRWAMRILTAQRLEEVFEAGDSVRSPP